MTASCWLIHTTANQPGAIAILQLVGNCMPVLQAITGVDDWPLRQARLVRMENIDDGLAVRLDEHVAQLMPHGGPRVVQRLTARLLELGAVLPGDVFDGDDAPDPQQLYPEAADRFEALMMLALARSPSPMAIDLLLDQPRRWRTFVEAGEHLTPEDRKRSKRLNRLLTPPTVVLAGRPNVGKSTLSNALLGRAMSIALDMPGTTRDYTAGRIDLAGLVVDWHDTPGLRESDDPIEARAIAIAQRLIKDADYLIAMTDHEHDWPDLQRVSDLRILNKADLLPEKLHHGDALPPDVLRVSATTGEGITSLVATIRDDLVPPADRKNPRPWLFDPRLIKT